MNLFLAGLLGVGLTVAEPVVHKENPLAFAGGAVVIDVEERVRYEFRENTFDLDDSGNAVTDGSFLLQRARLGLQLRPASWMRAYVQGQSSLEFSDRPKTPGLAAAEGNDALDLYQAYVEIADYSRYPLGLRAGRQVFNYGDQRLIGGIDWNNFGRSFDAVVVRYERERFWMEMFASSVVVVDGDRFNRSSAFDWNGTGVDQYFSGIYASTKLVPAHTVDAYVLWLNQSRGNAGNFVSGLAAPPAGSAGGNPDRGMDFVTLGTRFNNDPAKSGGWEYDGEFAFQTGRLGGLDLRAFAAHAGAGYRFTAPWEPRLYFQYNYATGDSNPSDGRAGTFQNLFPTNHKFYGYMDAFSWQNIHNPSVTLSVKPHKNLVLAADYHLFWLDETADAWYRANGLARVRGSDRNAGSFVGSEIDLSGTWTVNRHFSVHSGYSIFFPGTYAEDTGASDTAHFFYLQARFAFY